MQRGKNSHRVMRKDTSHRAFLSPSTVVIFQVLQRNTRADLCLRCKTLHPLPWMPGLTRAFSALLGIHLRGADWEGPHEPGRQASSLDSLDGGQDLEGAAGVGGGGAGHSDIKTYCESWMGEAFAQTLPSPARLCRAGGGSRGRAVLTGWKAGQPATADA